MLTSVDRLGDVIGGSGLHRGHRRAQPVAEVTTMTGRSRSRSRSSFKSSIPFMRGMSRSVTTMSGGASPSCSSALSPAKPHLVSLRLQELLHGGAGTGVVIDDQNSGFQVHRLVFSHKQWRSSTVLTVVIGGRDRAGHPAVHPLLAGSLASDGFAERKPGASNDAKDLFRPCAPSPVPVAIDNRSRIARPVTPHRLRVRSLAGQARPDLSRPAAPARGRRRRSR